MPPSSGPAATWTWAPLALLPPRDLAYLRGGFRSLLPAGPAHERRLRELLEDVLDHPGSLARAQLAFTVVRALGAPRPRARELATAVEYFHTASLLFDDLPAMDDARERRGRPCPHRVHGEAAAILGALALITEGYHLLWGVLQGAGGARRRRAGECVARCLGLSGILDGQARDLDARGRRGSLAAVERVARGKTVPLVRLALVLPAIVGGAPAGELRLLDELSERWGLAYQGLDDAKDSLLSPREAGKTTGRDAPLCRANLAAARGWRAASRRLRGHLEGGRDLVRRLAERRPGYAGLLRLQDRLEAELDALELRAGGTR